MLPKIHGEYRVVADPTLRFTPSGMAVAEFRVVADKKKKDEATNEWVDDKVVWLSVVCFKRLAENVAESIVKGTLVMVTGNLQTESYETKEGEKRQAYKVVADNIGLSLAFSPAKVASGDRSTPSGAGGGDPWESSAPAARESSAPAAQPDDPPF